MTPIVIDTPTIVVRIDFPALNDLLVLLSGAQQKQIDALSGRIVDLTNQLNSANAELQSALDTETT